VPQGSSTAKRPRRRARVVATLAGGVLAATAAGAVGVGLASQQPAPPQPPEAVGATPTPSPQLRAGDDQPARSRPQAARPRPAALAYAEPTTIQIPSIGVSSDLVDLGLAPHGVMETPQDPDKAGWFTPGPPPGLPGASVIAGHVTWNQRPVVFFRLGDLRRGDTIEVDREDDTTAVFEVQRLGQFPKNAFPTDAVYSHIDHPGLRLITCGGVYNEATNSYQANLIVWARLVATHPART
jgi:sortase (surface protein transpeptidase)